MSRRTMEVFERQRRVHRRSHRHHAMYALGALVVGVALAVLASFVPAVGATLPWMLLLFGSMPFADLLGFVIERGHVVASRDGVLVDGKAAFARDALVEAVYEPAVRGGIVRFMGARRKTLLAVEVRDEEDARRLLHAAGADVAKRNAFTVPGTLSLDPRMRALVFLPALLPIAFTVPASLGNGGAVLPLIALMVSFTILGQRIVRRGRRIGVGCDALLIAGVLSRKRVPIDDLEDVDALGANGVRLAGRAAPDIHLQLGPSLVLEGDRLVPLRDLVVARAQAALAQRRESADAHELAARLTRGTRSPAEWGNELRDLRGAERSYRSPALRENDLWTVVEDPTAPDDARAAAALLLERDPANCARLRVAALDVASPRLRVALDRVATADTTADPIDDVISCVAPARALRRTQFG